MSAGLNRRLRVSFTEGGGKSVGAFATGGAGGEVDDVGCFPAIGDEVHDFDAGALHVVQERVDPSGEEHIADGAWDGDDEAGGGGEEALVDAARDVGGTGEAGLRGHIYEGFDESDDGAEQSDERGDDGDGGDDAEAAFEARDFELAGFLDDLFQLGARRFMPDERGVDDAGDGARRARAFRERFGEAAALEQVREAANEFAHANLCPVEVSDPLEEDCPGEHTTEQEEPHQRPALLHVVDHSDLVGENRNRGKSGGLRAPAAP